VCFGNKILGLRVTDDGDVFRARVYRNTTDNAGKGHIIVQSRGMVYYAKDAAFSSSLVIPIPKENLPDGISQITIFDENGIAQCERLVFVNHNDHMGISIKSDRQSYEQREKVELQIDLAVKGQDSVNAVFSITVYDKEKLSGTEAFGMNIKNYLLLSSDLKGHIYNPDYYFQPGDSLIAAHADLLMLTQGWRRFTWQDISEWADTNKFVHERGVPIRGKVMRSFSKKVIPGAQIKILNVETGELTLFETDGNGNFFNDGLAFYDSAELVFQTDNRKGRQTGYNLVVDSPFSDIPIAYSVPWYSFSNPELLEQARNRMRIEDSYTTEEDVILLDEVSVSATKIVQDATRLYDKPDYSITADQMPVTPVNIFDALRGRFPGVQVYGSTFDPQVSIRGRGAPIFLLDGVQVPIESMKSIPSATIGQIDVLIGNSAAIYGSGASGVIAFYTKTGGEGNPVSKSGITTICYPGYKGGRQFYSPAYDVPSDRHNLPDERTTLFWDPMAVPDQNGRLKVEFFTADESSTYIVRVEGITFDGKPGSSETEFEVVK